MATTSQASGAARSRLHSRQAPQHAFFIAGKLLRLLSVYALFNFLVGRNASIPVFMFICLLVSGSAFLVLQRPWLGRPLSSAQIFPTVLNGGILALGLVCWAKSLIICGPVRTVLAEYTGAVLGAASTLALGRGGHKLKKALGLSAMLIAFYFLSKGWAMASFSPFTHSSSSSHGIGEGHVGLGSMTLSIISGTLMALRRIVARRISTKPLIKKRLHSITVAAAACFLFPVAMFQLGSWGEASVTADHNDEVRGSSAWAYFSTIVFGLIIAFYVDAYAEDRLQIHATSPVHFIVTSGFLILLELIHGMDFSLVGFVICTSILGLGIFEATSSSAFASETEDSASVLPTAIAVLPSTIS